jgi:hypothetical protein
VDNNHLRVMLECLPFLSMEGTIVVFSILRHLCYQQSIHSQYVEEASGVAGLERKDSSEKREAKR